MKASTDAAEYVRRVEALQELRVAGRVIDIYKELQDDESYGAAGAEPPPTKFPEFAEQKKAMRALLDMPEAERAEVEATLARAALDFTEAARRQEEADRAEAESRSVWLGQGCPTRAEVQAMPPLRFKQRTMAFVRFGLPSRA
jgi:hypothetical protein